MDVTIHSDEIASENYLSDRYRLTVMWGESLIRVELKTKELGMYSAGQILPFAPFVNAEVWYDPSDDGIALLISTVQWVFEAACHKSSSFSYELKKLEQFVLSDIAEHFTAPENDAPFSRSRHIPVTKANRSDPQKPVSD